MGGVVWRRGGGAGQGVMSPPRLPIDGGTVISAICQKKPMISKAGTFGGLYDGMQKPKKHFVKRIQVLKLTIDNRVGVTRSTAE
ncbi:hypothetical protein NKH93_05180 [Mesorhizobium sp. M0954]|uniref:hypothetical protein n=1 Tax=Mesorhizobium sp. M0954 TaxID=2957032 RepID=UPI003334B71D